jgi:hypothetical protein
VRPNQWLHPTPVKKTGATKTSTKPCNATTNVDAFRQDIIVESVYLSG